MIFPKLSPGDAIRVIAPASPFEARLVWRAMAWLSERYRVRFDRRIFEREGYLAGSDKARSRELSRALEEPGVKAIFCARGGYGTLRCLTEAPWSKLRDSPRWLVGFSDITALHLEALGQGVAALHGPNLTGLGRGDAAQRSALTCALESSSWSQRFDGLQVLSAGVAEGVLVGGNLALIHACAAAGRLALPARSVLLIEDIGEAPYRIDRMLTTLLMGGHLASVVAVVAGQFEGCHPGAYGVGVAEAIARCLAPLGVPVIFGAPVGHGADNAPLVLGAAASVSTEGGGSLLVSRSRMGRG